MICFLADASLHHAIVSGCLRREPSIDFLSANAAGLEGRADPEVLLLAARQNRIVVTHDFQTMPQHFAAFLKQHGQSPGVFLVKTKDAGRRSDRRACLDLVSVQRVGVAKPHPSDFEGLAVGSLLCPTRRSDISLPGPRPLLAGPRKPL